MKDIENFIRYAAEKSAYDKNFVGYYLKQYQDKEQIAIGELLLHLGMKDLDNYYRLCICRTENIDIENISEQLNFAPMALNNIINDDTPKE
tara:strand:- start:1715 stop:1987 length:273 start_codon:yes stop_codon:yes gene_type:complete